MNREKLRSYIRAGILIYFCGLLAYVVGKYTGKETDDIKPMTVFAFATGVIVSKLIENYMIKDDKAKDDKEIKP